jgi:hypothetical protein
MIESPEDVVNVKDPSGKVGSLPRSQVNEALDNGYLLPSQDEVKSARNEERFGGVQGSLFAGTLAAARTATLGASDLALTHLPKELGGFTPEQLKGLSDTNPKSDLVGSFAGILRDPLGLAGMVNKAGKAATTGAKTLLGTTGEVAGRTGQVLESTFQHSLEGALYGGIASTINDKALGDPNLNGEKVLSNIGYGYFLGGAAGGSLKLLGYGISPAIRKVVSTLGDIRNEIIGSGHGEDAFVTKVLPKRFSEAITDRQLNLDTKGQAATLRKMADNLNSVTDTIHNELNNFNSEVDTKATDALFKSSGKSAGEAQKGVAEYITNVVDQLKPFVSEDKVKSALDKLKNVSVGETTKGTSKAIFDSLKNLKGHLTDFFQKEPMLADSFGPAVENIDGILKDPSVFGAAGAASAIHDENVSTFRKFISGTAKPTEFQEKFGTVTDGKWGFDLKKLHEAFAEKDPQIKQANMGMLDDFYSHLNEMPENILNARKTIPNSSWKKSTLEQVVRNSEKSHGQAYEDYIKGIKNRRAMYGWKDYAPVLIAKWHPVLAAAIEAYDFYQDPVHTTHELAYVERLIQQTTKKSLDLIDRIFDTNSSYQQLIQDKNKRSDNVDDEMNKIKKYAYNPEVLADNLTHSTKELNQVAPNISDQVNLSTNSAMAFLASKLPHNTNSQLNPFDKGYKPSQTEITKFENYRRIVKDPLHALEQVKNRTISPETIETLNTVFPKLYQEMKTSMLDKYFQQKAKGIHVPYQTKQAISMFLGEPVDSSLFPQAIIANQITFQPKNQMDMQQSKPTKGGAEKLTVAARTGVQRSREES